MAVAMKEGTLARWRWELYAFCTVDALFVPLIGEAVEGSPKSITLVVSYLVWAALLAMFGATFFERTPAFIIRCMYYLICSALPLAFFGSFPNTALHLWLPISSCLGIFVGIALRHCAQQATKSTKRSMRSLAFRWVHAGEPLLPLHHSHTYFDVDIHPGADRISIGPRADD